MFLFANNLTDEMNNLPTYITAIGRVSRRSCERSTLLFAVILYRAFLSVFKSLFYILI